MALHFHGKAIFSTHNGEYARRDKIPTVRTVLRSDPVEDQRTMVARLQRDFPDVCIAITAPITDTDVYDYFDYCDATVQGFEFLRAVLAYIAGLNAGGNAKRATEIQDYVDRWRSTNTEAFTYIRPYHGVTDLFTETDIEEHGAEFLTDAMIQIKHQRMQEDDDGMTILTVKEACVLMITLQKLFKAPSVSRCNMLISCTTNAVWHSRQRQLGPRSQSTFQPRKA